MSGSTPPYRPVQYQPPVRDAQAPYQYPGNNYGHAPQPQYGAPTWAKPKPTSGKAIASLVIGCVCVFMWPVSILAAPVGLVLGWMGLRESTPPGESHGGRGLAIGGLVLNSVMFVITLLMVALFVFMFAMIEATEYEPMPVPETERSGSFKAEHDALDLSQPLGRWD
jgi:hypothetical protein